MDSFEFNKIIGGILATVFVLFSVSIVSDSLFAAHTPEKAGYAIEEADAGAPSGEATPAGPDPVSPLLASADLAAGQKLFARCTACHTDDKGGANKIGPNLWGVVDRPVASHEGFAYSAAMKEHAAARPTWDYEHLSEFILAPKATVKGTAMNFPGLKSVQDRANLIAYLRTTADSPAPLPDPAAAAAPAAPAAGEAAPAAPATPATGETAPAAPEAPAAPAPAAPAAPAQPAPAAPAPAVPAAPAQPAPAAPAPEAPAAPAPAAPAPAAPAAPAQPAPAQ